MKFIKMLFAGILDVCSMVYHAQLSIIPQPSSLTTGTGSFSFDSTTVIGISGNEA